tara:strand:+ start:859 stop:1080 length:222 start_codon:yes stop_codon:yes gene_type:complete
MLSIKVIALAFRAISKKNWRIKMPKLENLKIKKVQKSWFIDIELEIGEEEAEYWDLETEDEVEDFISHTLSHY